MKKILLSLGLIALLCAGCGSTVVDLPVGPVEIVQPTEEDHSGLTKAQIKTLSSLQMVDDYPLYTMEFYGEYPSAVTTGPAQTASLPWACTLFTSLADEEALLYGRNFDWDYSRVLFLYTHPLDGYTSVSIVDLSYFDFSSEELTHLDELPLSELTPLLEAPLWTFDGMNEYGLTIGMAAVSAGGMADDPNKRTVGSLGIMREVLDRARTVDEALVIFQEVNIDWSGGPDLHYLIADRSGDAILIEFYRGEMIVRPNADPWHLATNFICSSDPNSLEGNCWRYDTVLEELTGSGGTLSTVEGMDLLEAVSQNITQWSVIYGISSGQIDLVVGQEYRQVYTFNLPLSEE